MEISLKVEGVPPHHKKYIVARLLLGKLFYYDSYVSKDKAIVVMERLENALVVEVEKK